MHAIDSWNKKEVSILIVGVSGRAVIINEGNYVYYDVLHLV